MNATIIIAASSILLACVAFAFFMLQGGSDELTGSKSGSMTFTGEGHEYTVKYQGMVGDDVMSLTIFIDDGTHSALWVKTYKDGEDEEYETEEIFLNDAATYDVVEFENGVATSCRSGKGRDQEAINKMIDSINFDGGDRYSITEEDFDGAPVTILVTASVGDVTMPEFDWSTCQSIGDPLDPFRDGDSRKALEAMFETERGLGITDASRLAQDVYERVTKCVDATSWINEDIKGQACYLKEGCNFAFRGSDDNADWADNILGSVWTEEKNGAWIHVGFYNQLTTLIQGSNLEAEVKDCDNPVFIGHSLGGAIANVAHTYWDKGTINTYAGPGPYMGRRSLPCTGGERYHHCYYKWVRWWWPKTKRVCEWRHTARSCPKTWTHVNGKRTFHEYDPVPYATNIVKYNHGGGECYKIQWVRDNRWWVFWDRSGSFQSIKIGISNEPYYNKFKTIWAIGQNIASLWSGGTHYHSMSVHYRPFGV